MATVPRADSTTGVVHVRRHLTTDAADRRRIAEGAKSRAGRRSVLLDPGTVAALRRHRAEQVARRLASSTWVDGDLVFAGAEGEALHPTTVRNRLARDCRAAGIGVLTPHSFRHQQRSYLAYLGVRDAVARERLGHAGRDVSDRYDHGLDGEHRRAAEEIGRLLDAG